MLSLEWLGWVTMHSISLAHNSCHANELILFGHVFVWFCCCTVWVKWSCNIAVLGTVSRPGLLWWPLPFVVSQSWLSSHTSRSEMRPQGWGSKVVWEGEDLLFFTIRLWMADLWCSSCLCCALTHIQSAKELSPLKNLKRLKKKKVKLSLKFQEKKGMCGDEFLVISPGFARPGPCLTYTMPTTHRALLDWKTESGGSALALDSCSPSIKGHRVSQRGSTVCISQLARGFPRTGRKDCVAARTRFQSCLCYFRDS